jgi:hypothetical protein
VDAAAAATTAADVNVELADEGAAGYFGLILGGDLRFVDGVAAVRAGVGEGRLKDFIDALGR